MAALSLTLSLMVSAASPCGGPGWHCMQAYWFSDLSVETRDSAVVRAAKRMPWMTMWRGQDVEYPDHPRWIRHKVVARERLSEIAVRYGVEASSIREWNKLKSSRLKKGDKLRIRAKRVPPPRELIKHVVKDGDTWGTIAAAYRVETPDLHGWNWRNKELEAGEELYVWFDPGAFWTVYRDKGPPLPSDLGVPDGAISTGRPNRGRIKNAVQVPDSPNYTRRNPKILWGSSHSVRQLVQAFANFRHDTGYQGEVIIGSMSRPRGGRFPPHRSHQSGRDVDIRLPLLPGVVPLGKPNPDEIDWQATWGLVSALVDTGEVHAIYLETKLQRRLYEAARQLGVSHEELVERIQWPRSDPSVIAVVRHQKGHDAHIHVRFTCGVQEDRCKTKSR
jgi:hypothetical protein